MVPQFTTAVGHQPVDLRGADEQMKILLSNPLAREQKKLQAQQEKPTKYILVLYQTKVLVRRI
ncbi:MAG: hypothetical protein V4629_07295, partial [Pseudomonadota bacterium]